jgi:UDP-N-acetylmuramoylalanine--D-glutamate ligase
LGGYDKGHDYTDLGKHIKKTKNIKAVVLVGQVAERIKASLAGFTGKIYEGALNMKQIIKQARESAVFGDIVLLSPAAASFGMFKDAKDRGEQFVREVKQVINN